MIAWIRNRWRRRRIRKRARAMHRRLRDDYGHGAPYSLHQVQASAGREGAQGWEMVYLYALYSDLPAGSEPPPDDLADAPSPAELEAAREELAASLFDGDLGFGADDIDHVMTTNDSFWGFGDGGWGGGDDGVGGDIGGGDGGGGGD